MKLLRPALLSLILALSACTASNQARTGAPTGSHFPQADEQCKAQPDLDWCPKPKAHP